MANSILVPIDFTPVSLNALRYACALRNHAALDEVVAVHLLDPKIGGAGMIDSLGHNAAFQKVFQQMQHEVIAKTEDDLRNFVEGESERFSVDVKPLVAFGTIYDSFASLAHEARCIVTIMGTHGIIGLQRFTGSRAYKAIVQASSPFIVVQTKPYEEYLRWYLVFKSWAQLEAKAAELSVLSYCLRGRLFINVLDVDARDKPLPTLLQPLADRLVMLHQPLSKEWNMLHQATAQGATALGFCIDKMEEDNSDVYGISQPRVIDNPDELPVLCLTATEA
jgi:nucleotide-binding universal stress UspA family protein